MMDADGSNVVTRGDACAFFKGAFAGLSAEAMFHEVAANKSSAITADEFVDFWLQVRTAGYKEKDILAEVETLMEGAAWVGWQDGRHLHQAPAKTFPKRQLFCRLSVQTWKKCQQLFQSMDKHNTQVIAIEEAAEFFKGSFSRVSAVEMFNKMDPCNHGAVTAEEFMNFWIQVKASGYSEKDILDELDCLMSGQPWVAWSEGETSRQSIHLRSRKPFPTRPLLCKLSSTCWRKCEELFAKMDTDDTLEITRGKAAELFKGAFRTISVDAMFNVVDVNNDDMIIPDEFMAFWIQVKKSGYDETDICNEIDGLLEGEPWINWHDNHDVGHAGHEPLDRGKKIVLASQTRACDE